MRKTVFITIFALLLVFSSVLFTGSTSVTEKYDYQGQKAKPVYLIEINAWTTRIDYSGSNPVYIGEAQAGTLENETGWRIQKIGYDGSNAVNVTWAQGSNEFDFVWSNRTNYTYS